MDENPYIDYSWQKEAACLGADTDSFYSTHGRTASVQLRDRCDRCPVSDECLQHALKYEEYGYWANTGPSQRVALRRQLGIKLEYINTDFLKNQFLNDIKETAYSAKIKGRGRRPKVREEV